MVGIFSAMSGMMFRLLSNLTRPLNMFWLISESVSASEVPGSSVPMSSRIGNLKVWLLARFVDVGPPGPPQAMRARLAMEKTPSAFIRDNTGVIHTSLEEVEAAAPPWRLVPPPSSRHGTGARVRRRRAGRLSPPIGNSESEYPTYRICRSSWTWIRAGGLLAAVHHDLALEILLPLDVELVQVLLHPLRGELGGVLGAELVAEERDRDQLVMPDVDDEVADERPLLGEGRQVVGVYATDDLVDAALGDLVAARSRRQPLGIERDIATVTAHAAIGGDVGLVGRLVG